MTGHLEQIPTHLLIPFRAADDAQPWELPEVDPVTDLSAPDDYAGYCLIRDALASAVQAAEGAREA